MAKMRERGRLIHGRGGKELIKMASFFKDKVQWERFLEVWLKVKFWSHHELFYIGKIIFSSFFAPLQIRKVYIHCQVWITQTVVYLKHICWVRVQPNWSRVFFTQAFPSIQTKFLHKTIKMMSTWDYTIRFLHRKLWTW